MIVINIVYIVCAAQWLLFYVATVAQSNGGEQGARAPSEITLKVDA